LNQGIALPAYNLSSQEVEAEDCDFKPSLGYTVSLSQNQTKTTTTKEEFG
jgi:hypothetical protein